MTLSCQVMINLDSRMQPNRVSMKKTSMDEVKLICMRPKKVRNALPFGSIS